MIKEARGPVVDALKRHDPGLRVRWSPEKQKWAVDAPFKVYDPNWCPPPVRFERIGGDWYIEHLMPENSERSIQYREKRYVVCWARKISWGLYVAVVKNDSHRHSKQAVGMFDDSWKAQEAAQVKAEAVRKANRVGDAWDRFKSNNRKNDMGGAGISIKGMNLEAA